MADKLRIGIVGLGFGVAVHLPAFNSLQGAEVIAIADSGSGKRSGRHEQRGIECGLRPWTALVQDDDIDAVSVAVPPFAQSDVVCRALASSKHVLCEKPFGLDVNEAATMFEMAMKAGVVGVVGFQFRMEPGIRALKKEIEKGVIGRILHVDVVWMTEGGARASMPWSWRHDAKQGGGVLGALGCHVIDYLQWMLNARTETVFARGRIAVSSRRDACGLDRDVTAEDSLQICCGFSNDITTRIDVSSCNRSEPGHRIEITGSSGRLLYAHMKPFTPETMSLQIETQSGGLRSIELESSPSAEGDTRIASFRKLASMFVEAIHGKVDGDLPRFQDGYDVQATMAAVRKSLLSKNTVNVER